MSCTFVSLTNNSSKMGKIEINEIKRSFDLIKKLTNKNFVPITQLAKEMKIRNIEFMIYIEDNPKLFKTEPKYNYNKKGFISKNLGLCITNVYLEPINILF